MTSDPGRAPPRKQILVVEDHEALWPVIRQACREEPWEFRCFPTAGAALEEARDRCETLDAAVLDLRLPDMTGLDLLKALRALDQSLPVLVLTAQTDPDTVVRSVRAGAYDYVAKPFRNEDLLQRLRRAVETRSLARRVALFESGDYLASLMGPSQAVMRLSRLVSQVSPTDMSVVIEGESGTGKELLARRIHALSPRSGGPLVAVDCGAIPENLLESELFGYKRGSFTGASSDRVGRFQAAHGGSLLLDEIENLPLPMQAKLLRAVQEKEVTPIGADRPVATNVRLISASNTPLKGRVDRGRFRLDLYHRIGEFPILIPPLRERIDDLVYLAARFLREAGREFGKQIGGFSDEAWEQVLAHPWPGNARELRSVIRRAALVNEGRIERVTPDSGSPRSAAQARATTFAAQESLIVHAEAVIPQEALRDGRIAFKAIVKRLVAEIERCILTRVLERAGGNKSLASRILDLDYKTLHEKTKEYRIELERSARHEQAERV